MAWVEVSTQREFDAAVARGDCVIVRTKKLFRAFGSATVRAFDSATVRAFDSATVEAFDSATVRAFGSATVRAFGSATVRAFDSATVEAFGSATVRAFDSATVEAGSVVAVHDFGPSTKLTGGVIIDARPARTPEDWCARYLVTPDKDGLVILYKAVDDNFKAAHGFAYKPGTTPAAPDWDGGRAECGGGLHFCATPWIAKRYFESATRFVACPVRIDEIAVHAKVSMPDKIKAPRVAAPCWEVTIDGEPV